MRGDGLKSARLNSEVKLVSSAAPRHCTVIGLATRGIMMIESCSVIVLTTK
jgi:hypothetical protein